MHYECVYCSVTGLICFSKVVNAVVDNQGTVLNYSTNTQPAGHAGMMQQRTVMGVGPNRPGQPVSVVMLYFVFNWATDSKISYAP